MYAMTPASPYTFEPSTSAELENARTLVRQGRLDDAERAYQSILAAQPQQVEALRFLGNAAVAHGNAGEAVRLLSHAVQTEPDNQAVLLELGAAYRNAQRMDEARAVFSRALELSGGRNTAARLLLANVFELDGRAEMATLQYFRAIIDAQARHRWRDDQTTEPGLRQLVRHAMQTVNAARHDRFTAALAPFRHGINAARLGRVDAALGDYLQETPVAAADPREQPTFLHLPDVVGGAFPDPRGLDWLAAWSQGVAALAQESATILDAVHPVMPAKLFSLDAMISDAQPTAKPPVQSTILAQRGIITDDARDRAPQLTRLLESAPLVRITNYEPNAAVLVLAPGASTPLQRGRSNAFCTVAVAFDDSAPTEVTVGGEPRTLQPGTAIAFNPGYEFTYRNVGDAPARVLVADAWHPDIAELERDALIALISAIVAFDTKLEELA